MAALKHLQVAVSQADTQGLEPLPAKKGGLTLRFQDKFVHSKYDPQKEAEKFLAEPGAQTHVHIHFGLGLGYWAEEALRKKALVLVFEPHPGIIRLGLEHRPELQAAVLSGRLSITFRLEDFARVLGIHLEDLQEPFLFAAPFYRNHFTAAFDQFKQVVHNKLEQQKVMDVTLQKVYPAVIESSIRSLPFTLRAPGIGRLENFYRGKPGFILSSGPSLEKNINDLGPYAEKAVLFSVSRSARSLEKRGIQPHFIVHTEAKDHAYLLQNLATTSKTVFLLSDQCHPEIFKVPNAGVYVYQNRHNVITESLVQVDPTLRKPHVDSGGSVAHEAFCLAFIMGCNPIVLVGQDLATSGGQVYSDTTHNRSFEHGDEHFRSVPGYFGPPATSLIHYTTFIHWFEEAVKYYGAQDPQRLFINATEGGAAISGFQTMKLRDVLHRFAHSPIKPPPKPIAVRPSAEVLKQWTETRLAELALVREGFGQWQKLADGFDAELQQIGKSSLWDVERVSQVSEKLMFQQKSLIAAIHAYPILARYAYNARNKLRDTLIADQETIGPEQWRVRLSETKAAAVGVLLKIDVLEGILREFMTQLHSF